MRIQEAEKGYVMFELQGRLLSPHLVFEPQAELIEALTRAGMGEQFGMNMRATIKALFPSAGLAFVFASRRHQPGAAGTLNFAFFSAQFTPHETIVALGQETVMPAIRARGRAGPCALSAAANIGIDR
jgi:hypothetical protein